MTYRFLNLVKTSLFLASAVFLTPMANAEVPEDLKNALSILVGPRASETAIIESPMQGVYQIDLGGRVIYAKSDGIHTLIGDVFDTQRQVSLAEEIKKAKVKTIIDESPENEMIVFAPEETKRTITVYTDVDCGYCRKLHKEVPRLVENGVKVRYLWYPRSGLNTPSYDKAVSVWCAEDQLTAMNNAKLNNKIVDAKCDPNPVADQFNSGRQVGVTGTPTIIVDDGKYIPGYMTANELLISLGMGPVPVAKAATQ